MLPVVQADETPLISLKLFLPMNASGSGRSQLGPL